MYITLNKEIPVRTSSFTNLQLKYCDHYFFCKYALYPAMIKGNKLEKITKKIIILQNTMQKKLSEALQAPAAQPINVKNT
jgi:hypothetical protein